MEIDKLHLKQASNAALFALLNLTVLPVISFVVLLFIYKKTEPDTIARYYALIGIKTNVFAAVALFLVTILMIVIGGFTSAWTWVYVISYFVIVHAMFILFATWMLTRSWTGEKLTKTFLSK